MWGRGRGRAGTRAARPEPAEEASAWADQVTQFVGGLLAPLDARVTMIEEHFAGTTRPPPPERAPDAQPEPAGLQPEDVSPVVSPVDREAWLRIVERFMDLGAPEFPGSSDPLIADKWKEDVDVILSMMGVDEVQRQRLAAFRLRGDANIWYKAHFNEKERLTVTWDEFIRRFD